MYRLYIMHILKYMYMYPASLSCILYIFYPLPLPLSLSLSLSLSLLPQYMLQCWPLMKLLMAVITSSLSLNYRIQLQFLTTSSLTTAHATSHHLKPQKKTKKVQQTFIHVHTHMYMYYIACILNAVYTCNCYLCVIYF